MDFKLSALAPILLPGAKKNGIQIFFLFFPSVLSELTKAIELLFVALVLL